MSGEIKQLSKYSLDDVEKKSLIEDVLAGRILKEKVYCLKSIEPSYDKYVEQKLEAPDLNKLCESDSDASHDFELTKYCPECGRKFPDFEIVCLDCLVHLKDISVKIDVIDIEFDPKFPFSGDAEYASFENLLSGDNIASIDEFKFTISDFNDVLHDVKSRAFKNFDKMVKSFDIDFDSLDILDKIILFAKSFVNVEYKSSGLQLGYYEDDAIYIDDRQTKSLKITTIIHELSHFLIHEILVQIICRILDVSKNELVETLVTFILSYIPFTELIDEYCAHNVEGRFTVFGFQDYSSYLQIESSLNDEMAPEEIEITKSIGNTFALYIKDIFESLIDRDLREEIKEQFLRDVLDRPNYEALKMENCQILNDEGFIKSLWLILSDGCKLASLDIDRLNSLTTKNIK